MTSLRQFPASPPGGGEIGGLQWIQTAGKITLSYELESADITEADVEVKMTGFQVEVSVKGQKVKDVTGDLYELVRPPPNSWWTLSKDGLKPTLVMQFMKLQHGSWPECFYTGSLHPRKKTRFIWTERAKASMEKEQLQIRLNNFEVVAPGRPDEDDTAWYPPTHSTVFSPKSDTYLCSPDDVVIGTNIKQDAHKLYLYIGFDFEALSYFESQRCYEDLFGADITSKSAYIFMRGDDQNPIINATFMGELLPEACSWKMVTDESFRKRQKAVAAPSPALLIVLEKAAGYCYEWPRIFESCWQHRLMVQNLGEYEEMIDAVEALQYTDDTTDPEYKASLQEKADNLNSFVEVRYSGIPDAMTYRRHGYDIDSGDYWANVYDYVNDTVKNYGYASAPTALSVVEAA
jgi:hypothetical protein